MATSTPDLTWHDQLTPMAAAAVREFLLDVAARDGRPMVHPQGPRPDDLRGGEHLLAQREETLLGYAHLDTGGDAFGRKVGELFVSPRHRGAGLGAGLVSEVRRHAGIAEGAGDRLRLWSHGDDPAAAALARRLGFTRVRELLRMRLVFGSTGIGEPVLEESVRIRGFSPGDDEASVARVNRRAFSWHPEQGEMTEAEVRMTEEQDWFDPEGFLLAVDADDRLLGFHWTKVHPRVVADDSGAPMGEVYVVGVDPHAQGRGLGKALTLAGLRYLHRAGLTQVMLYVESDNAAAIGLYESLGFRRWDADIQYSS
ncbi:MAG: mycothiol synthase [Sciscionella sp.]